MSIIMRQSIYWTDLYRTVEGGPMLDYAAIADAGEIVARELGTTPLVGHPLLDRVAGVEVLVKHEHVLPTGSFKVRGGVHLAASLTDVERASGLVTCSTG